MKKKLKDTILEVENDRKNNKIDDSYLEILYTKILFFQHERLIHLIVTFFTGIGCILFLLGNLFYESLGLLLLFIITLCLFVPYMFHYYNLENGVQKLSDIYIELKEKKK